MLKRQGVLLVLVIAIIGLSLLPVQTSFAQEAASESAETISAWGPAFVILFLGLGALGLVGLTYTSRQQNGASES